MADTIGTKKLEESLAEQAMRHSDEVAEMKAQNEKLKGKLNVSFRDSMTYSEVKVFTFETGEQMEEKLGALAGHILVGMTTDKHGNIVALVSREMDDEEIEDLQETGRILAERKAERAKAKAEVEKQMAEKRAEAEREVNELLAMGRKARDYNLFEKNRELEKKVEELNKELKKARKAASK